MHYRADSKDIILELLKHLASLFPKSLPNVKIGFPVIMLYFVPK